MLFRSLLGKTSISEQSPERFLSYLRIEFYLLPVPNLLSVLFLVRKGPLGTSARGNTTSPAPLSQPNFTPAWDLSEHLQSPKQRNPEESKKSLPRGVWDPQPPDPQKVPKKESTIFWTFRTFFGTFWGFGVGGSQTPFGDFSETFRGFVVLGSVDSKDGEIPSLC